MSINLIPDPSSLPGDDTDYQKQNNSQQADLLGSNLASLVDGSTIPQGAVFYIGGSLYVADSDTAITGTPSNYVALQVDVGGLTVSPVFVADLTGVSWNKTYNGYYNTSDDLLVFDEAKAMLNEELALVKTRIGALKYVVELIAKNYVHIGVDGEYAVGEDDPKLWIKADVDSSIDANAHPSTLDVNFKTPGRAVAANNVRIFAGQDGVPLTFDHTICDQLQTIIKALASVGIVYTSGSFVRVDGHVDNLYHLYIQNTIGSGTVGNNIGLKIEAMAKGDGKRRSIQTTEDAVELGTDTTGHVELLELVRNTPGVNGSELSIGFWDNGIKKGSILMKRESESTGNLTLHAMGIEGLIVRPDGKLYVPEKLTIAGTGDKLLCEGNVKINGETNPKSTALTEFTQVLTRANDSFTLPNGVFNISIRLDVQTGGSALESRASVGCLVASGAPTTMIQAKRDGLGVATSLAVSGVYSTGSNIVASVNFAEAPAGDNDGEATIYYSKA